MGNNPAKVYITEAENNRAIETKSTAHFPKNCTFFPDSEIIDFDKLQFDIKFDPDSYVTIGFNFNDERFYNASAVIPIKKFYDLITLR